LRVWHLASLTQRELAAAATYAGAKMGADALLPLGGEIRRLCLPPSSYSLPLTWRALNLARHSTYLAAICLAFPPTLSPPALDRTTPFILSQ